MSNPTFPAGAPQSWSDSDLDAFIADVVRSLQGSFPDYNIALLTASTERQRRAVERVSRSSNRVAGLALLVSLGSVVLGGVASCDTLQSGKSTAAWQSQHLAVLEQIRRDVVAQRDELRRLMEQAMATPTGNEAVKPRR